MVDGQQRLRAIISFISPTDLPDYKPDRDDFFIDPSHNEEFGGQRFRDLPADVQQRILDYQFNVHTFPSDTSDKDIVQVFARMNSTGVRANAQELRNAEFYGPFKTISLQLAAEYLNYWWDWNVFTPDDVAQDAGGRIRKRVDDFDFARSFCKVSFYDYGHI